MISIIMTLFSSYNLFSHNKFEHNSNVMVLLGGYFLCVCVFYGTCAKQIKLSLVRSLPPRL